MKRILPSKVAKRVCLVAGISILGLSSLNSPSWAQFCTVNCGSKQIQFTPGERIQVRVANRTSSLIQIEQIYGTEPIALLPDQEIEVDSNFGTRPNHSLVFWDETKLPIRALLFRPQPNTLRIEIYPGGRPPGDRSIYIEDDGKVRIY